MNPNEKQLLQETYDLVQENNKILRNIRRSNRWSNIFRIFYWTLIIGASIGAFYFIQPYIDAITKTYGSLEQNINDVKGITNKITNSTK